MIFVISGKLVNSVVYMFPGSMTRLVILHVTLFYVAIHITCLQYVSILMVYESLDAISYYYVSWNGNFKGR